MTTHDAQTAHTTSAPADERSVAPTGVDAAQEPSAPMTETARHDMTTHDAQTARTTSAPADERSVAPTGVDAAQEPSAPMTETARHDMTTHDAQTARTTTAPADERSTAPTDVDTGRGSETPTDGSLFASNDLSGLRSRWDDVQASFVDDPRDCVQKA